MASEAIWADHLREANPSGACERTSRWHFVDIEIGSPNIDQACFNHPVLPAGIWASEGPAKDCIIDKIMQFETELAQRTMPAPERLLALKFLFHFIGDLHQPLHAADESDRGGNESACRRRVSRRGLCTISGTVLRQPARRRSSDNRCRTHRAHLWRSGRHLEPGDTVQLGHGDILGRP